MYYSIEANSGKNDLKSWYMKRFNRIIIPYSIIMIPYYCLRCVLNKYGVMKFFYYFSTLGYWCEHDGIWYVAMMIPLYIVTPLITRTLDRARHRYVPTSVIIIAISICYVVLENSFVSSDITYNISFVLKRAPLYFAGLCIGKYVMQKRHISWMWIAMLAIVQFVLYFTPLRSYLYTYGILAIVLSLCICNGFQLIKCGIAKRALSSIGGVSLESYILNVVLIDLASLINRNMSDIKMNYGNYLSYGLVMVFGVISAYYVRFITCRITERIKR